MSTTPPIAGTFRDEHDLRHRVFGSRTEDSRVIWNMYAACETLRESSAHAPSSQNFPLSCALCIAADVR
jgi:hypothetical protein